MHRGYPASDPATSTPTAPSHVSRASRPDDLPPEATTDALSRIAAGGPFLHAEDGLGSRSVSGLLVSPSLDHRQFEGPRVVPPHALDPQIHEIAL